MFLEIATTMGYWRVGLALYLSRSLPSFWSGADLFGVRVPSGGRMYEEQPDHMAWLRMDGTFRASRGWSYHVRGVPLGFHNVRGGSAFGPLGIGSGAVKVLAMDKAMKLPFKVSTTTSNFMIGLQRRQARSLAAGTSIGFSDAGDAGICWDRWLERGCWASECEGAAVCV